VYAGRSSEQPLARRVIDYVEEHYRRPISLRDVAEALGYSPAHLTAVFSRLTGTPVTAWIIRRRIRAAQELLSDSNQRVFAISQAVGFSDLCYFNRQFMRHTGVTPGEYRHAIPPQQPAGAPSP
jgi:AraC family transcriptional regulator, transcriptional activator of pobA